MLPVFNTGYILTAWRYDCDVYSFINILALFSGPTHYIFLVTAAFFGLGMYVVGSGIEVLPFSILAIIATCAGAVLAFLTGVATLRLSGIYFVIFTLGLAEFIRQIVTWVQTTMERAVAYMFSLTLKKRQSIGEFMFSGIRLLDWLGNQSIPFGICAANYWK